MGNNESIRWSLHVPCSCDFVNNENFVFCDT